MFSWIGFISRVVSEIACHQGWALQYDTGEVAELLFVCIHVSMRAQPHVLICVHLCTKGGCGEAGELKFGGKTRCSKEVRSFVNRGVETGIFGNEVLNTAAFLLDKSNINLEKKERMKKGEREVEKKFDTWKAILSQS